MRGESDPQIIRILTAPRDSASPISSEAPERTTALAKDNHFSSHRGCKRMMPCGDHAWLNRTATSQRISPVIRTTSRAMRMSIPFPCATKAVDSLPSGETMVWFRYPRFPTNIWTPRVPATASSTVQKRFKCLSPWMQKMPVQKWTLLGSRDLRAHTTRTRAQGS